MLTSHCRNLSQIFQPTRLIAYLQPNLSLSWNQASRKSEYCTSTNEPERVYSSTGFFSLHVRWKKCFSSHFEEDVSQLSQPGQASKIRTCRRETAFCRTTPLVTSQDLQDSVIRTAEFLAKAKPGQNEPCAACCFSAAAEQRGTWKRYWVRGIQTYIPYRKQNNPLHEIF